MNYTDVMVDLETLGTKTDAVITEVGISLFNLDSVAIHSFSHHVDIQDCINQGMSVSGDTILWWMQQDEDARHNFCTDGRSSLAETLTETNRMINSLTDIERVWANGTTFDIPILQNAYDVCDLPPFWNFRQIRDTRLFKDWFPDVERPKAAVPHAAWADAEAQALYVQKVYQHLNELREDGNAIRNIINNLFAPSSLQKYAVA